ncbi:uncharacterized protein K452DRAFT_294842 [Aplosporella prunicola CBS 121167]|uniref:GDP/GTP exchange factor Sec2 N-terminal domain-containing protein n=1 Tax=Aplosporella prunicola CBS 121167 TaxID=1176127 RepID=A0A6A6BSP3_9PEZI|nr:uncharacterized protein K452DRAFT_294842 [Aplosporella prunicola CBS 121167]KAF2146264.1 hypothetical protein K452DRAFT_294842 [Aplosporella prunicola CBS 121167]
MKSLKQSTSTPVLHRSVEPGPSNLLSHRDSGVLNTIPDPRTPSPNRGASRGSDVSSAATHHPDLSNEVATLSTKLINAINHQTNLDDNLQATRHELEAARARIEQLEAAAEQHARQMRLMIKKEEYDKMEKQLRKELDDERKLRLAADREKKRMESELESLTTALFEEANTMVAAARKEKEASDKKGEQLKTQLKDTESLLASQQEQLQDLKAVMAQMSTEREEEATTNITAPSTPAVVASDRMSRNFEQASFSPNMPNLEDMHPAHPLFFTQLISPVLRDDTEAYHEFQELIRTTKNASAPNSRAASGNYGGLNVMGLGSFTNLSTASLHQTTSASGSSLPSSAASPKDPYAALPALKDIRFYKRALTEDIEPTLRLDNAPGLSWLARRTVLNSMTAGSLTIEPHPPILPKYRGSLNPCSMCGEGRQTPVMASEKEKNTDPYARKHRFRTSDAEDAQRYPLCDFCLARVRSSCDYIGFLRMCRDGHWRAQSGDEERSAWEESVKLRERMFWARIGGGVIPAALAFSKENPAEERERRRVAGLRKSVESELKLSAEEKEYLRPSTSATTDFASQQDGASEGHDDGAEEKRVDGVEENAENADEKRFDGAEDVSLHAENQEKPISIGNTEMTHSDDEKAEVGPVQKQDSAVALDSDEENRIEKQAGDELHDEAKRRSLEAQEQQIDSEAQLFDDDDEEEERDHEQARKSEAEQTVESTATPEAETAKTPEDEKTSISMPGGFE